MIDLFGKQVLLMGLGVHGGGLGAARWLLGQGAHLTVTDMASPEALAASLAALDAAAAAAGTTVRYRLGTHHAEDFTNTDLLLVNPAVRPDSPWLALAAAHGVPVETEMTLFFRACRGPILGVTGTKGKTTTALLLTAMLRQQYPDTVAAGNLRVSALEALERIGPQTPVVLELSSFQLERLGAVGLSPHYSLITNLAVDHLNWHGSFEAYALAKRQIYQHQPPTGVVALNGADDGTVEYFSPSGQGRVIWVAAGPNWSRARSRSAQATVRAIDLSVELRNGQVRWYDLGGRMGAPTPLQGEMLFSPDDLRLPGTHNLANAMLAASLAHTFGVAPQAIRTALHSFTGVEHRLELVRTLNGVAYINDTTATNPSATLAALTAIKTPLVLIAGGADKALEFAQLGTAIARRVKALVLLEGSATGQLAAAVTANPGTPLIRGPYRDFAEAIHAAQLLAAPGDSVILSPGCASFGMFRNEFDRGEEFRRIVGELEAQ